MIRIIGLGLEVFGHGGVISEVRFRDGDSIRDATFGSLRRRRESIGDGGSKRWRMVRRWWQHVYYIIQ